MENSKIDSSDILSAASRSRQLNSLLENIFINGTCNGCPAEDELIEIAYDLCGKVSSFLDILEREEEKNAKFG